MKIRFSGPKPAGFTLVEVLVSTALLVLIMVLVFGTVEQTQKVWARASTRVTQFQSARNAFDSMTRRLSQATLNTYYRAFDENRSVGGTKLKYTRNSELHFLCGPTAKILSSPPIPGISDDPSLAFPTHSFFFQAPLGYSEEPDPKSARLRRFRHLNSALVATGYFIEHSNDTDVPEALRDAGLIRPRMRYRLMQLDVPTEKVTLFRRPLDVTSNLKRYYRNDPQVLDNSSKEYVGLLDKDQKTSPTWTRPLWMKEALARQPVPGGASEFEFKHARPLAENVVALVVLPKVARQERGSAEFINDLTPDYSYDSWRVLGADPAEPERTARYNQLPPIMQVIMIAIDEPSGARVAERYKSELPDWSSALFQRCRSEQQFRDEVATLESRIAEDPAQIKYRTFSTDVVIRGSKWSKNEPVIIINE